MIIIAAYDPAWPGRFATEASVPGLAAKPVVDIQVSVPSFDRRDFYRTLLTELGYTHVPLGTFDLVYPFFKRPASWPSTHHVHLCVAGSEHERDHLIFRDYLRRNPSMAAEYLSLKRKLASVHDGLTLESQERYSLSKTEFVRSVLARAAAEAQLVNKRDNA